MKHPVKNLSLTAAAIALLTAGAVSGAEKQGSSIDPSTVDLSRAQLLGVGTDPSLAMMGKRGGAYIAAAQDSSYGFASGISPERGSFRLGVLLADFQVAAQAGDKIRTIEAAKALSMGLAALDAPPALLQSAMNLTAALQRNVSLEAIAELARPLLLPHIKAFVQSEGQLTYLYLGEWTETVYLAASVGAQEGSAAKVPVDLAGGAATFAKQLGKVEGTPPGAVKALEEIGVAAVKDPGTREMQALQRATETLKGLMG
jgi:hypothetical protein